MEKLALWGDCPQGIIDDLEAYTNHQIVHAVFTTHAGSIIMVQLEDCTNLSCTDLKMLQAIEICYRGYLFGLNEIRFTTSLDPTDLQRHVVVIFGQLTRMM